MRGNALEMEAILQRSIKHSLQMSRIKFPARPKEKERIKRVTRSRLFAIPMHTVQ